MEIRIKDQLFSIEDINVDNFHKLESELATELSVNPKARVNDLIHTIIHKKYNARIRFIDPSQA